MAFIVSSGAIAQIDRAPYPVFPSTRRVHMGEKRFMTYEEIWRHQPALRTTTSFIARNLAQVGLKVMVQEDSGAFVEDRTHPMHRLLHDPMPGSKWTHYRLVEAIAMQKLVYDNAFILKVAADPPMPIGLLPIPPRFVTPMGEDWFEPQGYRVRGNMGEYVLPPDALVHIYGWNPTDPRSGISPIETLRTILAEEFSAMEYREQLWRSGARTAGVISRPAGAPEWGEIARDRFLSSWAAMWSGESQQAGGTPVLEEGMTWEASAMTPRDAQYVESRALTKAEVMEAYFVPQANIVSDENNTPLVTLEDIRTQLYGDALAPYAAAIEQDLEQQLLCDVDPTGWLNGTVKIRFDFKEKMRGNLSQEYQMLVQSVGGPWMTRNEGRAIQGLAPIEGYDEIITPLNVTEGGLANPMDTAPTNPDNAASNGQVDIPVNTTYAPEGQPKTKVLQGASKRVRVGGDQAVITDVMQNFYKRQGAKVTSAVGAAVKARKDVSVPVNTINLANIWNADSSHGQLSKDLTGAFKKVAAVAGVKLLIAQGGDEDDYDVDRTNNWMAAHASGVASAVVAKITSALGAAIKTDNPLDSVKQLFANYTDTQAGVLAQSETMAMSSWGAEEGARQGGLSGQMEKVWNTGENPRESHSAMDGETTPVGETFSNGARYPGDSSLDPDERDGCNCSIDMQPSS